MKTVEGGAKAVGKLVTGDPKGALEEVKQTPLYKSGEELVENIKEVGSGIIEGDLKKVGNGLLGVVTNDIVGFIPGEKLLGIGAKAAKKGIKKGIKKGAKKDLKNTKDDIVEKGFKDKKPDKKDKQRDRNKQCPAKNNRPKREAKKRKRGDCDNDDDDYCKKPTPQKGKTREILKNSLNDCADTKVRKTCNYLCQAGYNEKPSALTCQSKNTWNPPHPGCEPQECGANGFIFVESSTIRSVLDKTKGNRNVLLYLVLFDESKKLPIYSVAYYKFTLTLGKFSSRANNFRVHPCTRLIGKQADDKDYSTRNPHVFHRGHLTPADLFRWNEKAGNSGNLHINVAPQSGKLNIGSWKTLEAAVQCAAQRKIKAIVATGVAGNSMYKIGIKNIAVPKYFWKMVCYRELRTSKTHVALFVSENEPVEETLQLKKHTLTPRSQKDMDSFNPSILTFHNPWNGVLKMKEDFALIKRFPTAFECMTAMNLEADQVKKWKAQFSVFDSNKKKRSMDGEADEPFCSRSELNDILAANLDVHDNDENDDEDDGTDEGIFCIYSETSSKIRSFSIFYSR